MFHAVSALLLLTLTLTLTVNAASSHSPTINRLSTSTMAQNQGLPQTAVLPTTTHLPPQQQQRRLLVDPAWLLSTGDDQNNADVTAPSSTPSSAVSSSSLSPTSTATTLASTAASDQSSTAPVSSSANGNSTANSSSAAGEVGGPGTSGSGTVSSTGNTGSGKSKTILDDPISMFLIALGALSFIFLFSVALCMISRSRQAHRHALEMTRMYEAQHAAQNLKPQQLSPRVRSGAVHAPQQEDVQVAAPPVIFPLRVVEEKAVEEKEANGEYVEGEVLTSNPALGLQQV